MSAAVALGLARAGKDVRELFAPGLLDAERQRVGQEPLEQFGRALRRVVEVHAVILGDREVEPEALYPVHDLAYNLANFMRTLALPKEVEHWSLTTLREKLVKIGAKMVSHGRYVTFQLAEVAVPRELFRNILSLIDDLRPRPAPA